MCHIQHHCIDPQQLRSPQENVTAKVVDPCNASAAAHRYNNCTIFAVDGAHCKQGQFHTRPLATAAHAWHTMQGTPLLQWGHNLKHPLMQYVLAQA